ncbi:MAG: 3-isopropylmalate dehydratase small subunit [Acidiferrobacteraceae bacterium]|nr:3-isopropylmalate dehydratase small subunit [Acidiferrobacteraceae bacterium]|tara:strand:+ start:168 stop:815 length:648 start_codon:yes stop_codon:yes gene_type:complete
MKGFKTFCGLVAPIDRANIDTDAIIPKQFLKSIKRTGFGPNLFDEWRYLDHGEPEQPCDDRPKNTSFVLNQEQFSNAEILLTKDNFGCGSSREHAVWALVDYGFRAVIAPSFADIFYNNCFKNGLLPIILPPEKINELFAAIARQPGYSLTISLQNQSVATPSDEHYLFQVDEGQKERLLNGLDDIDLTMQHEQKIADYESAARLTRPWLFEDVR